MEPISSRNQSSASREEDWAKNGEANECREAPDPRLTATPAAGATVPEPAGAIDLGVQSLVQSFQKAGYSGTTAPPSTTPGPADTNAGRTSERTATEPYAAAGRTRSGDGFFGVAALKTHDPRGGVEAELFTVSAQAGSQNEMQAGLGRVTFHEVSDGIGLSSTVEVFTARASGGVINDDGSRGANLGAGAVAVGVETTVSYSGWSLTTGAALSVGASVSSGERDSDGDGSPEQCFKGSIGIATLGVCTEL